MGDGWVLLDSFFLLVSPITEAERRVQVEIIDIEK